MTNQVEKREQAQEPRRALLPSVDIVEESERFLLTLDLPGVGEEGVELTLEDGVLTLEARSLAVAPEGFRREHAEYEPACEYRRVFHIGDGLDADAIEARMSNGVLRVVLPKARPSQRRIEIATSTEA